MLEYLSPDDIPDYDLSIYYNLVAEQAGGGREYHESMYRWPEMRKRMDYTLMLIDSLIDDGHLRTCCEVGCGAGLVTKHLALRFDKVLAIDFCEAMLYDAPALDNVHYLLADVDTPSEIGQWREGYRLPRPFDLVVIGEVLEHLLDPQGTLDRMLLNCRMALVTMPVNERLNESGAFDASKVKHETRPADATGHIWAMDMDGFRSMLHPYCHLREPVEAHGCGFAVLKGGQV